MIFDYKDFKCLFLLGWFIFSGSLLNCDAPQEQKPLEFKAKQYVCYQALDRLTIDGLDNELSWKKVAWTSDFEDILGDKKPAPFLKTNAKMLWDNRYFYFFAKLEEPHIWATLTERDAVIYHDDDFEIFIDPDGDGHNYYEFEINGFNTLWDLFMHWPYHVGKKPNYLFNWSIPDIKTAVHIEGTINVASDEDQFWTIEMAIPWSALGEMAKHKGMPRPGEQWRINFSRVDWPMEVQEGQYVKQKDAETGKKLRENNWVWQSTGKIDMHRPEQWGFVQFAGKKAGDSEVAFVEYPDEQIKAALRDLYYQQKKHFRENGMYFKNKKKFVLPILSVCSFDPIISTGKHSFEISAPSCQTDGNWVIRQDARIEFIGKK